MASYGGMYGGASFVAGPVLSNVGGGTIRSSLISDVRPAQIAGARIRQAAAGGTHYARSAALHSNVAGRIPLKATKALGMRNLAPVIGVLGSSYVAGYAIGSLLSAGAKHHAAAAKGRRTRSRNQQATATGKPRHGVPHNGRAPRRGGGRGNPHRDSKGRFT